MPAKFGHCAAFFSSSFSFLSFVCACEGGGDCKSWKAKLEFCSVLQIAPGINYGARWLNGPVNLL